MRLRNAPRWGDETRCREVVWLRQLPVTAPPSTVVIASIAHPCHHPPPASVRHPACSLTSRPLRILPSAGIAPARSCGREQFLRGVRGGSTPTHPNLQVTAAGYITFPLPPKGLNALAFALRAAALSVTLNHHSCDPCPNAVSRRGMDGGCSSADLSQTGREGRLAPATGSLSTRKARHSTDTDPHEDS